MTDKKGENDGRRDAGMTTAEKPALLNLKIYLTTTFKN